MVHDFPMMDKYQHKQSMFCGCVPTIYFEKGITLHNLIELDHEPYLRAMNEIPVDEKIKDV